MACLNNFFGIINWKVALGAIDIDTAIGRLYNMVITRIGFIPIETKA